MFIPANEHVYFRSRGALSTADGHFLELGLHCNTSDVHLLTTDWNLYTTDVHLVTTGLIDRLALSGTRLVGLVLVTLCSCYLPEELILGHITLKLYLKI